MKTTHFGLNSFSDQMIDNQLSKFIKSDVLSKSNNFSDALKKTEEENEQKNKNTESHDLHIKKLVQKIQGELKVGSSSDIEVANSEKSEDFPFSATAGLNNLQTENVLNQKDVSSVQKLNTSGDDLQTGQNNTLSAENTKLTEKLVNKTKNSSLLQLDPQFKAQDQLEKFNLSSASEIKGFMAKDAKQKLGLNVSDIQSRNNLSLQKNLRSKNIDNKSKIGFLKATQIYEKQQPTENKKADVQLLKNNDFNLVGAGKLNKLVKTVATAKVGSDSLKNDLMFQAPTQLESPEGEIVGKKDFSNILEMQTKFKAEGIDDVIQKAQLLANKGGGELKLLLNPKGLGSVQLKVLMEDNQLKVQMATETKEAQEVIESTLGDLKKALADNNLDVESISIDSFNELNDLLEKEEELSKNEFAKDFLSEFRQQNNSWRQGLLGFPAVRQRQSQIIEQPEVISAKKVKSNRKLDLVA